MWIYRLILLNFFFNLILSFIPFTHHLHLSLFLVRTKLRRVPPPSRQPPCVTKLHLHHLQGSHHAPPSFSSRHAYTASTTVYQQRPPSCISTTSNVQILMHLQRALPCTTYFTTSHHHQAKTLPQMSTKTQP